ncbi:hypothetical protein [Pelagibius sp.]|uniref:hypothetical protein n=1 Tax=Pelagibius sp. TaxID=1931238 RepID=UPI003B514F48
MLNRFRSNPERALRRAPHLHATLQIDRNALRARYNGQLVYDLLEKDIVFALENQILTNKWHRVLWGCLPHRIKRLLRRKSTSRRTMTSIHGKVLFVASIENNLNSMLPAARALKARGIEACFLVKAAFMRTIARSKKDVQGLRFVGFDDIPILPSESVKAALRIWNQDLQVICSVLADSGYTRTQCFAFTTFARRMAEAHLGATEWLVYQFQATAPLCVVAPRPKSRLVVAPVIAARAAGIETIFMAHTSWFRELGDLFKLYDLSCFDSAIVYSNLCAADVRRRNSDTSIYVSGWPQLSQEPPFSNERHGSLIVGYPCNRQYDFLQDLAKVVNEVGGCFLVKGHPPGNDKEHIARHLESFNNVVLWDHNEISLREFFASIDVLVCGKSNVGVEASSLGVPTISLYTDAEEAVTQVRRRSVEARDVALWSVSDLTELRDLLSRIAHQSRASLAIYAKQQAEKCETIFPKYDSALVADFIIDRASGIRPVSDQPMTLP